MEIKSFKEKAIEEKIDSIISGEENKELNLLIKMAYLGKQDEQLIEQMRKKRQEDLELLLKEFQLTDITETINCKTELIIKSQDNIDEQQSTNNTTN